jgi:hypothetical protein
MEVYHRRLLQRLCVEAVKHKKMLAHRHRLEADGSA